MSRFLAGFFLASLIWGGLLGAHLNGIITINLPGLAAAPAAEEEVAEEVASPDGKARKKRSKRKRRNRGARSAKRGHQRFEGEAMTGDRLGGPETRDLNAATAGGEEQLRDHEVESGFDSAFPTVRRCLMLVASEEPVRGKLVFGMRISGAGRVTKVNLKGPAVITRGEAGGCMRKAVRKIKYRAFNGPDMLVHYPMTLE